eukprot:INCI7524.1.p1 GENE.INCI7524.1~~INCI7524.1.p1  ORF type:complete len:226 (-),score=48.97 INCI7524.1:202-879(-)
MFKLGTRPASLVCALPLLLLLLLLTMLSLVTLGPKTRGAGFCAAVRVHNSKQGAVVENASRQGRLVTATTQDGEFLEIMERASNSLNMLRAQAAATSENPILSDPAGSGEAMRQVLAALENLHQQLDSADLQEMYLSASGRDLVYLLEGILHGELASTSENDNTLQRAAQGRADTLTQQRQLLLQRLDVLDKTDRELMARFADLKGAMQCTTPELEQFWAQVWSH